MSESADTEFLNWWLKFVDRLRHTMDSIPGLGSSDRSNIEGLIGGGEWHMAVELLCTQLYEYNTPIPERALAELLQAAADTQNEHLAKNLLQNPRLVDPDDENSVETGVK